MTTPHEIDARKGELAEAMNRLPRTLWIQQSGLKQLMNFRKCALAVAQLRVDAAGKETLIHELRGVLLAQMKYLFAVSELRNAFDPSVAFDPPADLFAEFTEGGVL